MTDSYGWFQSSASSQINLVAGLQVFRYQRSSTSAISDSDSSSSTPWDRLFWGPPKPLCFASLKQLRHLDSYELAQVAKQDPVAKVRTLKRVSTRHKKSSYPDLYWWMFVAYHQQIAPMYLKWAFKSNRNIWKVKSKWFNPSVSRRRRFPDSEFSNKSPVFWLGPRTNGRASTCICGRNSWIPKSINQVYTSKIWSKEWNKEFNISDDL